MCLQVMIYDIERAKRGIHVTSRYINILEINLVFKIVNKNKSNKL